MLYRDEWNEAIAERLSSVREQLRNQGIPVGTIPNQASSFGMNNFQSIDWVIGRYAASPPISNDGVQEVTINLIVRLFFEQRRTDQEPQPENSPDFPGALEWAESRVLSLLPGFRLPRSRSSLILVSGVPYPPEAGQWQTEITFSFTSNLVPKPDIEDEVKPTDIIGIDDQLGQLTRVER